MGRPREARTRSTSRRRFLKSSAMALAGGLAGTADAAKRNAAGRSTRSAGPHAEVRAALGGPWPSLRTPFTRDGDIDFEALRRMLDFLIETSQVKAVVLTFGDSLYSILSDDEVAEVTRAVCRHVGKRAFVVAADRRWWTGKEVAFAQYCAEVGADMLMVLPPDWAASTTVDTIVAHYAAVADHIPVMLVTNYLGRRGTKFGLDLVRRLVEEVPGVKAVKDDVGGEFIRKLCLEVGDRWVLSAGGQKQNHMNMLAYGADGYLSTFITFKPEIAWKYWHAVETGDLDAAVTVIREYDMPLFDYLIARKGSFDAALHGILELAGLAGRWRRPPYYSLNNQEMEQLENFLSQRGMLG